MADTVTIHLRFAADTTLGVYQDTLMFSEDEWAKRDDKAIAVRKQALADTWVSFRTSQIWEEEALKTSAGKLARIAEIDTSVADLLAVKAALSG